MKFYVKYSYPRKIFKFIPWFPVRGVDIYYSELDAKSAKKFTESLGGKAKIVKEKKDV